LPRSHPGQNLTLIANNGNVNVDVPITKQNINSGADGGSLNLIASGDININAVVVGAREHRHHRPGDPIVQLSVSGTNIKAGSHGRAGMVTAYALQPRPQDGGSQQHQYPRLHLPQGRSGAARRRHYGGNRPHGREPDGTGGVSVKTPNGATQPVEIKATNITVR